jgi:hypothetical protein
MSGGLFDIERLTHGRDGERNPGGNPGIRRDSGTKARGCRGASVELLDYGVALTGRRF